MNTSELRQEANKAAQEAKAAAERGDWADWNIFQALAEDLAAMATRCEEGEND